MKMAIVANKTKYFFIISVFSRTYYLNPIIYKSCIVIIEKDEKIVNTSYVVIKSHYLSLVSLYVFLYLS